MPLVAFDLDGTLVDQARAAQEWIEEVAAKWGLPSDAVVSISTALAERRPKDELLEHVVSVWSLPLSGRELWAAYRRRLPELVQCSEEDKDALRRLRDAGWLLGIVTNGMIDNQEGKIRNTGLAEIVDGWVISAEVGVRKPNPAIFQALAHRLGCPLDGWMIGDSIEDDVHGGAAVGLRTAWISATGLPATAEARATITAPTVADAAGKIFSGMYQRIRNGRSPL